MPPRGRPPRNSNSNGNGTGNYKAKTGRKAGSASLNGGPSGGGGLQRARDKTRGQGARLYNDPFNDERQLEAQLKRLGLYAANTLGDGSCLFRSLSDQLHGTPNHHLTIRHEVCNFLLQHRDEFIAFIDDSNHSSPEDAFASHVAEMRNSATYGTQLEIVSFARMVQRRIRVVQAELVYVIGFEDESPDAKARREAAAAAALAAAAAGSKGKMKEELPDLYIVYHNWEHYSSARNIEGPHTGLPCIVEAQQQPSPALSETSTTNNASNITPSTTTTTTTSSPTKPSTSPKSKSNSTKTQEEASLILSSLRYPHRHTINEIRKLILDSNGNWEKALELLLENEIDETESEDFNSQFLDDGDEGDEEEEIDDDERRKKNSSSSSSTAVHGNDHMVSLNGKRRSPRRGSKGSASASGSGAGSGSMRAFSTPPPPSIDITAATPSLGITALPAARSSSPSASSSTADSATTHSQSTTATNLSDILDPSTSSTSHSLRHKANTSSASFPPASPLISTYPANATSSRVRSRAASPDLDIQAAESPRQRFRLSREDLVVADDDDATSSCGGGGAGRGGGATTNNDDNNAASSPASSSCFTGGSGSAENDNFDATSRSSVAPTPPPPTSAAAGKVKSHEDEAQALREGTSESTGHRISPIKSNRFPKRRESHLNALRGPTRRQRKHAAKTGTASGVQTRSKGSAKEEPGLQREFRELYV